jgi:hypothetical protein
VAVPSGRVNYAKLDIRGMSQYVDFWNLMVSPGKVIGVEPTSTSG